MSVMSGVHSLQSKVPGAVLGSYPSLGMAMRFAVQVHALETVAGTPSNGIYLGLWQSCKTLQVEFKYKTVEQGGEYTQVAQIPERISWPTVTLERAVQQKASYAVWEWLKGYIDAWEGAGTPSFPTATTMIITLLDYQLNGVLQWELEEVQPVKWVGPSLSAADNKVAIEQLVLEHQGFTCKKP
jgi:phage tail-like protein